MDKLKELNDKKVEAYNIIRQIESLNRTTKSLTTAYTKLAGEIIQLEAQYLAEKEKTKEVEPVGLDKPKE